MSPLLRELISRFVSGADRSIAVANAIEVAIGDDYGDEGPYSDAVEILARYRPEGGAYLTSATDVIKSLEAVVEASRPPNR